MKLHSRYALPIGLAVMTSPLLAQIQGPSSSATPYILPSAKGVETVSILTAGDTVKHLDGGDQIYRMSGIPDGLGAFDNDSDDDKDDFELEHCDRDRNKGTFTVLMNHELGNTSGVVRDHGGKGSFVSRWIIRKKDLSVVGGADQIRQVKLWKASTSSWYDTTGAAFNRFCSADLAAPAAFFNPASGKGTRDRLFLNGEETSGGRAVAHVVTGRYDGVSFELPGMGRAAWENVVASPFAQDKTVVIGTDDTAPGSVYVYVGMKRSAGNPVERAGLSGGSRFGIAVEGVAVEDRAAGIPAGARFSLAAPTDASVTRFLRPEDGAWDTQDPDRFYFVTTDRLDTKKDGIGSTEGRSRLWRLTFDDVANPETGGAIEMLLDGTEAQNMLDNMTVAPDGRLILEEDVGNTPHNGKVFRFDPAAKKLSEIAKHDPARFGDLGIPAGAGFSQDEEGSGVIPVNDIFRNVSGYNTRKFNYFLSVDQAHFNVSATDPAIVEKGQLLLIKAPK